MRARGPCVSQACRDVSRLHDNQVLFRKHSAPVCRRHWAAVEAVQGPQPARTRCQPGDRPAKSCFFNTIALTAAAACRLLILAWR